MQPDSELTGYLGLQHPIIPPAELRSLLVDMASARDSGRLAEYRRLRDRVVASHIRFAASIATRFRGRGVDLDDCVQHAACGITRACETYDPSVGGFTAYAGTIARSFVQRALANEVREGVRLPVHVVEAAAKVRRARQRAMATTGREPTTGELSASTGLTDDSVRRAIDADALRSFSLDAPRPDGSRVDLPSDAPTPYEALEASHRAAYAQGLFDRLPARERAVIDARADGAPFGQIARPLGVSREHTRLVEKNAVLWMRAIAKGDAGRGWAV